MTRKDVTYQDKLNELKLDLRHPNSRGICFILLEGETDVRLFRKLFNLENCKVEHIPGGNPKVEAAVTELLENYELVIGIRDADFIHLGNTPYSQPNVFLTDYHDIKMTMIAEDEVIKAFTCEYTELPTAKHISVREDICSIIEEISLLKWLNEIENLELAFNNTGFQHLLRPISKINFEDYFSRLLSNSPEAKTSDINIIKAKISALKTENPNPFQLCNGHDFIQAFSEFIRQQGKEKGINDSNTASTLRMSYTKEHFYKTKLFTSTKNWADSKNCDIHL